MPSSGQLTSMTSDLAAPAPSTPLGPFIDSAVSWAMWITIMGAAGVLALAVLSAGPASRRVGADLYASVVRRLARAALVLGALSIPATLTDMAHGGDDGGYHYGTAWSALYDGTMPGLLTGLEITCLIVVVATCVRLALGTPTDSRTTRVVLGAAMTATLLALATTRFPSERPDDWGRTVFETLMWMFHLFGGAVWLGGVAGLAALAWPGAVGKDERAEFWSHALRRFSVAAMTCVAAISLSGLFLYWGHVDGPSQLLSTMYGRVLGVKILIFGALLLIGMFNQFWLHPRVEALRATGDERPLHVLLARRFPLVIGVETLLAMALLFVAPFLHGSARNQAFQAGVAARSATPVNPEDLPRLPPKEVSASTWILGTGETLTVIAVMVVGYWVSGRLARRRAAGAVPARTAAYAEI